MKQQTKTKMTEKSGFDRKEGNWLILIQIPNGAYIQAVFLIRW